MYITWTNLIYIHTGREDCGEQLSYTYIYKQGGLWRAAAIYMHIHTRREDCGEQLSTAAHINGTGAWCSSIENEAEYSAQVGGAGYEDAAVLDFWSTNLPTTALPWDPVHSPPSMQC